MMRATDSRYAGERQRFDLAVRMIGHEARTGTIRLCTGFTEDRIRKIYASYFPGQAAVRRRRGKSPSQIAPFVNSARRQGEASLLAGLFVQTGVVCLDRDTRALPAISGAGVPLGCGLCDAFEAYRALHPDPQLSFEWTWNLYRCLVSRRELRLAWCALCEGPYVQDAYALDYERCPFCEVKDHA
ncbi:MAG: hypothetical protein ABIX37_11890 [Gammaproteobacteria bacterium]